MLLVLTLTVGLVLSEPQNRRRKVCPRPGKEFLDLIPEDYSQDEYDKLLIDFKEFLDYNQEYLEFLEIKRLEKKSAFIAFANFDTRKCNLKFGANLIADSDQCDKYWECTREGELIEKLCKDGFVFDDTAKICNHPSRVDCEGKPGLQDPQPSPGCPRQNGYFYDEDDVAKCQEYTRCIDGKATPDVCSNGLVWSPSVISCTIPRISGRDDCANEFRKNQEFICPVQERLRFDNHDRLRNPNDCGKFYVCLKNGDFDKASCSKPLVFHERSGSCKNATEVEGCEDYIHF